MIAKDLDPFECSDPRELAGRAAEEQMAFYLKRRFQDDPDVWVFNGLRFQYQNVFTQIDHLVLCTWGIFVVESKSVTTSVMVNERGEWARQIDGVWKGMASPLEQANEQLLQLLNLLNDHADEVLSKVLGALQRRYGGFERGCYCAVSDNGIIERATQSLCPEALKADQIGRVISERMTQLKQDSSFLRGMLNLKRNPVITFVPEDLLKTKDFLLKVHTPRKPAESLRAMSTQLVSNVLILPGTDGPSKPVEAPRNGYFCSKCGCGITPRVAQFCWTNKGRFGGKAYCMGCQKGV